MKRLINNKCCDVSGQTLLVVQKKNKRFYVIHETPWRISLVELCYKLNLTRDRLNRLIRNDPKFPRPIKESASRQGYVYFDLNEINDWLDQYIGNNKDGYSS